MAGLSYVWHGVALTDVAELRMSGLKYAGVSAVVYLVLAMVLTWTVHFFLGREWINLKGAFPLKAVVLGAVFGAGVYLLVLFTGLSFADHGVHHVVVDLIWQVVEQSVGGLMVGLGIVYDLHRSFMEAERAS